jgi:hypothetical protein
VKQKKIGMILIFVGLELDELWVLVLVIDVNEWCSEIPPDCDSVAETTISRVTHCSANEHIHVVGFTSFYNYNFDSGNFFQ